VTGLAVVSAKVIWASDAITGPQIRACPKPACAGGVQLYSSAIGPSDLAGDDNDVYWSQFDSDSIRRCPTGGCDAGTTLASGANVLGPVKVAIGASTVAWISNQPRVMFCQRAACTKLSLDDSPSSPSGLVSDGSFAYWVDGVEIRKCSMLGCSGAPDVFNAGAQSNTRVAAGGKAVYWTTGAADAGMLKSCGASGSVCADAGTAATGLHLQIPVRIAADASGVFVAVEGSGGSIVTCPPTGCSGAPTVVVDGQGSIRAIGLDADRVYFATTAGAIRSVRK
jgi:hypothetical protein